MRIAYLLDWDITANSGVLNKVQMQVDIWEKAGNEVFVCFASFGTKKEYIINAEHVRVFERPMLAALHFSSLRTFIGKAISFKQIFKYLKSVKPDVLYFRQNGMWLPYLDKILNFFPSVMEVNTLDLKEINLLYGPLSRTIYKFGRKKILKAVRGFVTVTNEIGRMFTPLNKPIEVIANGTQINIPNGLNKNNKQSVDLIFVGSPGQIWQGEDLVIKMARLLPAFDFHIVGCDGKGLIFPDNVRFYGYLNKKDLSDLYKKIDIGIGTLALYRKGMKEACPLKVREYLSLGLPIILGYEDTDIKNEPFALNIRVYEDNIQDKIEEIKIFVNKWKGKIISEDKLVPLIGLKPKEDKRLAFMKKIAGLS